MADDQNKLGEITITYNGPGDATLDPPIGRLNRDVQTMTWTLVDLSGLNARFVVPGGIVFPWPPDNPPPVYSRWSPPGTVPVGDATRYTANAQDKIPHGHPRKLYSYDIVLERDDPERNGGRVQERIHAGDLLKRARQQAKREQENLELEIIDPPVENEPLP